MKSSRSYKVTWGHKKSDQFSIIRPKKIIFRYFFGEVRIWPLLFIRKSNSVFIHKKIRKKNNFDRYNHKIISLFSSNLLDLNIFQTLESRVSLFYSEYSKLQFLDWVGEPCGFSGQNTLFFRWNGRFFTEISSFNLSFICLLDDPSLSDTIKRR